MSHGIPNDVDMSDGGYIFKDTGTQLQHLISDKEWGLLNRADQTKYKWVPDTKTVPGESLGKRRERLATCPQCGKILSKAEQKSVHTCNRTIFHDISDRAKADLLPFVTARMERAKERVVRLKATIDRQAEELKSKDKIIACQYSNAVDYANERNEAREEVARLKAELKKRTHLLED